MSTAILAGVPSRYLNRVKQVLSESDLLRDWTFAYLAAPRGPSLQIRDRKQIHAEAEARGSLHVIGFSAERNRDEVAAAIRPYFRFRWFQHGLLSVLDTPVPVPFVEAMLTVLRQESEWAARIRPSSDVDSLLLPEQCFKCSGQHRDMWRRAEDYGSSDSVPAAEKAKVVFERQYRQRIQFQTYGHQLRLGYKWMDDRRVVFDEDGARHGTPLPPRRWKYSFRIQDGFHYDVSKQNRDGFNLTDVEGREHTVVTNSYLNLEVHGFVC